MIKGPGVLAAMVICAIVPGARAAAQSGVPPLAPAGAAVTLRTPEQYAQLVIEQDEALARSEYKAAEEALLAASQAEPGSWKFKTALAAVLSRRGEHVQAIALADAAVKLDPKSSRAWYWQGQTRFNHLAKTRSLDSLSDIDGGKNAMLTAVALDAGYAAPRMALGMFYIEAPGIVGGSVRKAREQGNELLKMAGDGPYLGRVVLARCAMYNEKWSEVQEHYRAMEEAATTPGKKAGAAVGWAGVQVNEMDEPEAALKTLERAMTLATDDQTRTGVYFLTGEARRKLKDLPGAIESYRKVLAISPESRRTRYTLAEALEKTKQYALAAEQYREFATRFPEDEKAADARKKAERLMKKVGK